MTYTHNLMMAMSVITELMADIFHSGSDHFATGGLRAALASLNAYQDDHGSMETRNVVGEFFVQLEAAYDRIRSDHIAPLNRWAREQGIDHVSGE